MKETKEKEAERPVTHWVDFGKSKVYLQYHAESETLHVDGRPLHVSGEVFNGWLAFNRELGFNVGAL